VRVVLKWYWKGHNTGKGTTGKDKLSSVVDRTDMELGLQGSQDEHGAWKQVS
jgi:hypothetical protein